MRGRFWPAVDFSRTAGSYGVSALIGANRLRSGSEQLSARFPGLWGCWGYHFFFGGGRGWGGGGTL